MPNLQMLPREITETQLEGWARMRLMRFLPHDTHVFGPLVADITVVL